MQQMFPIVLFCALTSPLVAADPPAKPAKPVKLSQEELEKDFADKLTGATLVAGSASTTVVAGAMYSFPANGSEPTTLGLSASEAVDVIVLRFRNLATISGTATNSTIANADPPSHDMGSSAATTWLTMLVVDSTNTTGGTITARPANYDESLYVPTFSHANGIALCLAWRDATAQLENPGVWANAVIANVTITAGARR